MRNSDVEFLQGRLYSFGFNNWCDIIELYRWTLFIISGIIFFGQFIAASQICLVTLIKWHERSVIIW